MTEKVVRDGLVAILISPGYGAGWTTNGITNSEQMLFCPEMVNAVLEARRKELPAIAKRLFPDAHFSRQRLQVIWVPLGTRFTVCEYDGYEYIITEKNLEYTA